jgi:fucose permease
MGTSRNASRGLIAAGVACLVVSSLADSLRAPLLPLLAERYAAGYDRVSGFLVAGSVGALAFNLLALGPLARLSDRSVVGLAAALQAAAMAAAAAAPGLGALTASGAAWGAGNTALGMCANLLVIRGSRPESRARTLSLLHLFYGVTCVLPPLYVGAASQAGWRVGAMMLVPAALPALLLLGAAALPSGGGAAPLSARGVLASAPWAAGGVIALYVLGEVATSMWLVALATARGVPLADAGLVLSGFFLSLALGRAATAVWARGAADRVWVPAGLLLGALGAGLGGRGVTWGYLLAGFSFGPVYPLVMARLSAEREGTLRDDLAFVYAAMVVAIAVGHRLMGWTAEAVSPAAAGALPPVFLLAALALWASSRRAEA